MPAMPKGPRGERRPGDVVGAAIKVAKIATGEIEEDTDEPQSAAAWLPTRRERPRLCPILTMKLLGSPTLDSGRNPACHTTTNELILQTR